MSYTYEYERPALTVDGVIFALDRDELSVLLIKRLNEPFKNTWALPGGFFDMTDESAEEAAAREIKEETCISDLILQQLFTFSKKGRDPRGRTLSIAYYSLVERHALSPVAADDAKEVSWFALTNLPELAFDHEEVIAKGVERLREPGSLLEFRSSTALLALRKLKLTIEG